ncbi:hypothetical protein L6452_08562 [Arctium lappa]|uniref:Uncharacterized protein n=1 Tax=Arctium lappa TaxID=4217 RepID=A0ACB9DHL3_ARCLA|nr:hypothetical protein L6452_08562 [Arctium lappa]
MQHGHATLDPLASESPMEIDTYNAARDERESERKEDTDHARLDDIQLMDDKIALIVTTKWETETLLESLLAKYPNDESFANYIYILQDIYKYDIRYGSSMKEDFSMHGDQNNVFEGEGTSHSPLIDVKPLSVVKAVMQDKGKGVCLEDEGALKKFKKLDESYHELTVNEPGKVAIIPNRRTIRLGDHLRSPYVRRVVDMKVSAEDKRIHEWTHTSLGGIFDTVVLLDNGAKLIWRDLETLVRNERVSPTMVDMWAELLNSEEKYRNRDSMSRCLFTTIVMEDPRLHTPLIDFNTQYDIFSAALAKSAHFKKELLEMQSNDLAFFPIHDAGNYYLVVFNLKSPSVIVLDNRFLKVNCLDDTVGTYEDSVDILVMI